MTPIRAILIEDEPSGMENLRWKLNKNCPSVEIIDECMNGNDAINSIKKNLPDVIFLDIMLGDMTGFDVLKKIKYPSFEVIFTTSYDHFAIEAIKNSALDYLLKPVEKEELMDAVSKATIKIQQKGPPVKAPSYSQPEHVKIGFPVRTGKQFLDIQDIVYVQADDNVSVIHLTEKNQSLQTTKSLSWAEAKLENHGFCRIHKSYLINLNQMKEYIRNDGGYVIMNNEKAISISRSKKDEFLQKLKEFEIDN